MAAGKGFVVEDGQRGRKVVVTSSWHAGIAAHMCENEIDELELNYAKGWQDDSVAFLDSVPHVRSLDILDRAITDVSPIHQLHGLKRLYLHTYCDTALDISCFPELEGCFLEWRAGASSILSSVSLRRVVLNGYTSPSGIAGTTRTSESGFP